MAVRSRNDQRPVQARSTRRLWVASATVFLIAIAAYLLNFRPSHFFAFDGFFTFYAAFGFLAGLAIIGVSKAIGAVLSRPDSYYDTKE
jgi:hypothetical protein